MSRDFDLLVDVDCLLSLFLIRRHFGFTSRTKVGSWIVVGSDPDTVYRVRLVARSWMVEGVPSWSMGEVFAFHGLEVLPVAPVLSPDSDLA